MAESIKLFDVDIIRLYPHKENSNDLIVHKPIDHNLLCLKAQGKYQEIGAIYFLEGMGHPVTCPECLEWMHA